MAARVNRRTAPAATSFAIRMRGSFCGETLSARASMAVLKPSAERTPPKHKITAHHSEGEMWKKQPAIMTRHITERWILAWASLRKRWAMPRPAYLKALILFLI